MDAFRKKMSEIVMKYSPKRKKVKRNLEEEMDDTEADTGVATNLSPGDKQFMMDLIVTAHEDTISSLTPIKEQLAILQTKHSELEGKVESLSKGCPPPDLESLKDSILQEVDKRFASWNARSPPGLSAPSSSSDVSSAADPYDILYVIGSLGQSLEKSECEERARQALNKAGADEPADMYAPFGLGSVCFVRYNTANAANKAKCLLRRNPTKFEGEKFSVWLDVKKSSEQRKPTKMLAEIEKALAEIKATESAIWKVIRCGPTKRLYIDKKEAVRLEKDLSITWANDAPIDPRHRQEITQRAMNI